MRTVMVTPHKPSPPTISIFHLVMLDEFRAEVTTRTIPRRMEAAVVTKQEIDEAREAYRTVATRGSIIYFVIADMALTRRPSRHRRASSLFEAVRTESMLRAWRGRRDAVDAAA